MPESENKTYGAYDLNQDNYQENSWKIRMRLIF